MKPTWIIQDYSIEKTDGLVGSLEKFNIPHIIIGKNGTDESEDMIRHDNCIVGFCTLETARRWNRMGMRAVPGTYYNERNYDCTTYLNHYWFDSLNQGMFITYDVLRRSKSMVYEKFGNNDVIFIRPNVGYKTFTGTTVYKEHFVRDVDNLGYGVLAPESLILVAEPRNIHAEYRVVICDKKAITMSQYRKDKQLELDGTHIPEVMEYAEQVTGGWQPDRVFVADIAKVTEGYKLIEINTFSCAGLYKCNTDIIVEEVSRVAVEDWEDMYGT